MYQLFNLQASKESVQEKMNQMLLTLEIDASELDEQSRNQSLGYEILKTICNDKPFHAVVWCTPDTSDFFCAVEYLIKSSAYPILVQSNRPTQDELYEFYKKNYNKRNLRNFIKFCKNYKFQNSVLIFH